MRPKLKKEIDRKIARLRKSLRNIDSAYLLGELALYNLILFGDKDSESEYKGPTVVDYILSLTLADEPSDNESLPSEENIVKVQKLARDILLLTSQYFSSELADDNLDKSERDLRFFMMQRQLLRRGDAYKDHELDTAVEILQPLNDVLFERFGFRAENIRNLVRIASSQFQSRLREDTTKMAKLKEAHELFKKYCDDTNLGKGMTEEQFRSGYENLPEVKTLIQELSYHTFLSGLELCEVVPDDAEEERIIKLLSCRFGENKAFLEGDWKGWPLNDSIITRRLFVQHDGKYFCFARHALSYHLRDAIEGLIREDDNRLFENRYEPARNSYLERTSLSSVAKALPGCNAYSNLYYTISEEGKEKRCELDGLILFDTTLILIEAKAGTLSVQARRGSVSRLRKDIKKLIDKPFDQCLRARDYILGNDTCAFFDKKNREVCRIEQSTVNEIFMIAVTLDSLGPISGDLNTVRQLGLAKGDEWFWSVGIHDLRIITDLTEFPTQLLHYIQRRIRVNTQPVIKSIDEVDLFGVYLTEGLFFEDRELEDMSIVSFNGYTDAIDDYYYRVEAGQQPQKPRQDIPDTLRVLIHKLEGTQKRGFSEITTALLNMDDESRRKFAELLEERIARAKTSDRRGNFSMTFQELSRAITVTIEPKLTTSKKIAAREYCVSKMSELQLSKWYCIMVGASGSDNSVDFAILR
ncbi:MAG: hypothetical protein ABII79_09415 [bacterium]